MNDDTKPDPNDDTANHSKTHNSRPKCDECSQEQKRLAYLSAAVGAIAGMAVVYLAVKNRG